MDLNNRINRIKGYNLNLDTFSIYPYDSESIQELLSRFFTKINETVKVSNDTLDLAEWLVNEGLSLEVANNLQNMLENGVFEEIINKNIFNDLNNKVDTSIETSQSNKNDLVFLNDTVFKTNESLKVAQSEIDKLKKGSTKSIYEYGVVGKNITSAIGNFINDKNTSTVFIPNGDWELDSQIIIGNDKHIIGESLNTIIKYIGSVNERLSMFIMGHNIVGANETTLDKYGLNSSIKNLRLIGKNRIGFGIYGTYLGDNIIVDNVVVQETTQYAMYFARCWYPRFTNLVAFDNMGKGLAFGVPLVLRDGTMLSDWVGDDKYNMNTTYIENIRANYCGKANDFEQGKNMNGYGLGLGSGNGFYCTNFLSENNFGVGVYSYLNGSQVHKIENGYIERNCRGQARHFAIYYEVSGGHTKFIEANNIYINEVEAEIFKTGSSVTNGSFTISNIAYGKGCFTDDPKGNAIFVVDNCYYLYKDNVSFIEQGFMIPTSYFYGISKDENNVSPEFALPVQVGSNSILNFYYIATETRTNSGQVKLTDLNGNEFWKSIPTSVVQGEVYNLGSINGSVYKFILESDVPIEQKCNFGVYQYTGIKPIRE